MGSADVDIWSETTRLVAWRVAVVRAHWARPTRSLVIKVSPQEGARSLSAPLTISIYSATPAIPVGSFGVSKIASANKFKNIAVAGFVFQGVMYEGTSGTVTVSRSGALRGFFDIVATPARRRSTDSQPFSSVRIKGKFVSTLD